MVTIKKQAGSVRPKKLVLSLFLAVPLLFPAALVFGAFDTWGDMALEMSAVLDDAAALYAGGDTAAAKKRVDDAYYGYYEKYGFEKTVMAYISGSRAAAVEYQFSAVKKSMTAGETKAAVSAGLAELARLLTEDAARLDGKGESAFGVFAGALVIILREGFEAIIIVGAILAWLKKSGVKKGARPVYWGSGIALALSVVMAVVLNALSSTATGQGQEMLEGFTMLVAVAVLFYVSNWMVSKAEAAAWSQYIESKTALAVTRGSMFSLAFTAFLAVFREGAETILFYQALLAQTHTHLSMIYLGLALGAVLLVGVFMLIRVLSIRIPLRPFFLGTSILLFVMSITFIGNGVKELQEANLVSVTPVSGIGSIDMLGVYPTWETLIPQAALLVISVVTFVLQLRRGNILRKKTDSENRENF
ncbi:MAG: FTR1 family iron permease [Treponema sp.]|jgi:high-affinity iron transporter|nr:FTR1 family iron permease [Treponema sp.]